MKELEFVTFALLVCGIAIASPTKQELAEAKPLVSELMAPTIADFKAKAKSAVDVAQTSMQFAESAKGDAAKYLFLRGAVIYYVRGGEFGKAADTVELLKSKVGGVAPADIVDIISTALSRENARKAPRLQSQLQLAQAQVKAAKDARRLAMQLRQVSTDPTRRQYAEALALGGDWRKALREFAKVGGDVGKWTKGEVDGTAQAAELGDFWWGYEPSYAGIEQFFREHAANYYRKAIEEGRIDGLKKTLVEQRLASLALPDVATSSSQEAPIATSAAGRAQTPAAPQVGSRVPRDRAGRAGAHPALSPLRGSLRSGDMRTPHPSGLVHRWSFTDGFADSVGNVAPSKSDNAKVEDGHVALQSGSPLEFPAGTVPLVPFTIQVWASATEKGLGAGDDYIFKLAPSAEGKNDGVFWRWTATKKWFSRVGAFGKEQNCYAEGGYLLTGKPNLYTLTAEKDGKGMLLKFYRDDTVYGTMKTEFALKKPPALILGGFVTPTYDEVRIYSRALTHAEIITSLNDGADKLPASGKK